MAVAAARLAALPQRSTPAKPMFAKAGGDKEGFSLSPIPVSPQGLWELWRPPCFQPGAATDPTEVPGLAWHCWDVKFQGRRTAPGSADVGNFTPAVAVGRGSSHRE